MAHRIPAGESVVNPARPPRPAAEVAPDPPPAARRPPPAGPPAVQRPPGPPHLRRIRAVRRGRRGGGGRWSAVSALYRIGTNTNTRSRQVDRVPICLARKHRLYAKRTEVVGPHK